MIWELIGGIFFILLSIVIAGYSIDLHRYHVEIGYIPHVGVIAVSDTDNGQIIIDYTVKGKSYSAPFDCKLYARVGVMPPVGLKVKVIVEPDAPDQLYDVIFSKLRGRYVNYNPKSEVRKVVYAVLICFLFGLRYIFQAFGWI